MRAVITQGVTGQGAHLQPHALAGVDRAPLLGGARPAGRLSAGLLAQLLGGGQVHLEAVGHSEHALRPEGLGEEGLLGVVDLLLLAGGLALVPGIGGIIALALPGLGAALLGLLGLHLLRDSDAVDGVLKAEILRRQGRGRVRNGPYVGSACCRTPERQLTAIFCLFSAMRRSRCRSYSVS
jgi:hypothetical protein